jgi:DNA-binding transcriptional regulator YiaG
MEMPNIGALLKEEIRRLAKREARLLMASLRKDNARLKRTAAQFKRSLAALERNTRRLVAEADARLAEGVKVSPEEAAQVRLGASRVRALRKRLRLSQAELGQLLGVSPNTVFQWESKQGRLNLRDKTKAAIVAALKLSAKEAKRKLELMAPKPVAKKKAKGKRKKR